MTNSDIKYLIDYFHDTVKITRNEKAIFIRGKDGRLVARALAIFSRPQLEMLALWFLSNKKKLAPTIGAMLSSTVLEELQKKIKEPNFWKELDALCEKYYPQSKRINDTGKSKEFFSGADISALKNKLFTL